MIHYSSYRSWQLTILLFLVSCGGLSEEEIDTQAKARYEGRVEQLRIEKIKECKIEIDRKADIIADSLIRALHINPLETLYKPPIPERPEFVEVDSSVFISKHSVKPIPK
ncbi:MAG: hypothetical protein ACI9FN_001267 [Saprospiraceae bacterium]